MSETVKAPVVPLIMQYQAQLHMFKQQRDNVKNQFEQLTGAIFACEQMISQYEESVKKVSAESSETQGESDGEVNSEATEQAA